MPSSILAAISRCLTCVVLSPDHYPIPRLEGRQSCFTYRAVAWRLPFDNFLLSTTRAAAHPHQLHAPRNSDTRPSPATLIRRKLAGPEICLGDVGLTLGVGEFSVTEDFEALGLCEHEREGIGRCLWEIRSSRQCPTSHGADVTRRISGTLIAPPRPRDENTSLPAGCPQSELWGCMEECAEEDVHSTGAGAARE